MKKNLISENGLRYSEKENKTPFNGGDTTSCVKCGNYKLRKQGQFINRFGSRLFYCNICKPPSGKSSI
jgi:hypothetical protein